MITGRAQLLAEIEAFLEAHDYRATYFGRDTVGDFSLVNRLRRGGGVRLTTADKIRRFMATYKGRPKAPADNPGRRRRAPSKARAL